MRYIDALNKDDAALCYKEKVTKDQERLEVIMLGLRKMTGVTIEQSTDGLSAENKIKFFEQVRVLKEKKFITQKGDTIFLTKEALSVENEIAARLAV